MKQIMIAESKEDLKVLDDMLEQLNAHGQGKGNTSPEIVVLKPNVSDSRGEWAQWVVYDNRGRECFVEDFTTLDGALLYAADMRTTCEDQIQWDVPGRFHDELVDRINGEKHAVDPLERWDEDDGGHDSLVGLFVDSIVKNVNGRHTVRYLTEEHDNGDGTSETEHLVELTFLNAGGAMGSVDHALESMTGRDWRRICDKFLVRRLVEAGAAPDNFDWPTPDARVTLDYYEDEDDVVKTATVVWAVDQRVWEWCNPDQAGKRANDEAWDVETPVTEWCPHCEHEVTLEWNAERYGYKAFCPHCGKELMLCDECRHAKDNPEKKCPKECMRKEVGL